MYDNIVISVRLVLIGTHIRMYNVRITYIYMHDGLGGR